MAGNTPMTPRALARSIGAWFGAMALCAIAAQARAHELCDQGELRTIPARVPESPTGSEFAQRIASLSGTARDAAIRAELLAGNMPGFLRHLVPVRLDAPEGAAPVGMVVCVLPDYLAVGSDRDFVFVPMGLKAALSIAQRFGFSLPTPKVVDAIYSASVTKLNPLPLPSGDAMRSTAYFVYHNELIGRQREYLAGRLGELTAGDKKDLVLTPRLWEMPGRVAIYGWHRGLHQPIQPLSLVHGARYADYSHGVRFVSGIIYVNGKRRSIAQGLADPQLSRLLSNEGPIPNVDGRLATLMEQLSD